MSGGMVVKDRENRRNIRLVVLETVVTWGLLADAILTPFFLDIGLNQEEIAFSQMIFTIVLMALNIPLGWVADRFGRKWANVAGDLICAVVLLCYSQAQTFWQVVMCETAFGAGVAFSQGVDSSLLKHFCDKEDSSGEYFKRKFASTVVWSQVSSIILTLLGGPIGAISFRLAIGLSSVTRFIGAVLSLFVKDDSPRMAKSKRGAFGQMVDVVSRSFREPQLRIRIVACAVARKSTHGIIWVFTPLMLAVGVPLSVVSFGWVVNHVAASFGAFVARRYAVRLKDYQNFMIPILLVSVAGLAMFFCLNIVTIWLYALFGIAQGWSHATAMPMVKEYVPASEQAVVESLAQVCAQLLYVVTVWVINRAADIDVRYALLATVGVFLPIAIPVACLLKKSTKMVPK